MAKSVSHVGMIRMDQSMDEAFPEIDPGQVPLGSKILVQIKTAKERTAGGIFLPEDTKDALQWNTCVAKVILLGSLAFCNRETMKPWPEGAWCKVGDFVRVPKHARDQFEVKAQDGSAVLFALVNDLELCAKLSCDPRDVLAFV